MGKKFIAKSWLKKDFSELRKERKEKSKKEKATRVVVKTVSHARLRESPVPRERPRPKSNIDVSYTVKIWVKGDNESWTQRGLTKEQIDVFSHKVAYGPGRFVKLGDKALVNLAETVYITISKHIN